MRSLCIKILILVPSLSWAASFNCDKAASPIEKLICGNAKLSQLDNELSLAYKRELDGMSFYGKDALIFDQKEWLESQRNKCRDINCLKEAYRLRIDDIHKWNEEASNDKDIFGHYSMPIMITNYNIEENGKTQEQKSDEINCLSIDQEENGKVRFEISVVANNYNACGMAGVATFKGSYYEFTGVNTDAPDCMLRIKIKKNSIIILDPDNKCYESLCGVHAVLDGKEFRRKNRSNDCYEGKHHE